MRPPLYSLLLGTVKDKFGAEALIKEVEKTARVGWTVLFRMREKKMLIIPQGLVEKIDGNRGDMSRVDFLDYCINLCLREGETEGDRYVTREEFERLKADVNEVRTVGLRILEKFETVDAIRSRLDQVAAGLVEKGPKEERAQLKGILAKLKGEERKEVAPGALVLVEWDEKLGPVVKATCPKDWELDDRLDQEMITAVYTLNVMSKDRTEHMRLEFKDSKVVSVGSKEASVVLLVLDPDQDIQKYQEKIMDMTAELERGEDWEEVLPDLYQKYLQPGL